MLSEVSFKKYFEESLDALCFVLDSGAIEAVNQKFLSLTDYTLKVLKKNGICSLEPNEKNGRKNYFKFNDFKKTGRYDDVIIRDQNGSSLTVDLAVKEVHFGKNSIFCFSFREPSPQKDISEELQKKHLELKRAYAEVEKKNYELQILQQTLVQAGKMAALGELAAGLAHELNQPLQGVRGYAQELQSVLGEKSKTEKGEDFFLKEIISNVDKMAKIIQQLRIFTRKSTENFEWVLITDVIEEVLKLFSLKLEAKKINTIKNFSFLDLKVFANPVQLEQVFINLVSNAIDAIEEANNKKREIHFSINDQSQFVDVLVKDSGCGMNDFQQKKAMNPFFTTKEVGQGTGLGLSISYGILQKIHGSLLIESQIGKGSTFTVRIPKDYRTLS